MYNQVFSCRPSVQSITEKPHQPYHKEASKMLFFFWRNLRQGSEETKIRAYFTMVQSNLDYCCTIWSQYQPDLKHMVEMAQMRAPRFVTRRHRNTNSFIDMFNHLKWKTQEVKLSKLQLTVLFKMLHDLIHIPPSDYLTPTSSMTRKFHSHKYLQYPTSTDCFKNSICSSTIPVWKRLPETVAKALSLASFKRKLSDLTF